MAEILILVDQTRVDQRGPDQAMTEINARTVMFNLGPEDAIDSTTSAKIACYTKRKQLAYKLTVYCCWTAAVRRYILRMVWLR